MKRIVSHLLPLALLCGVAWASDVTLTGRWDYINTRNNGSDDTQGLAARIEVPVWREFSVALEGDWHSRQYFPCPDDPKGAFGSLYGYGVMPEVLFRPTVTKRVSPYVFAGVGYYWWDFKENPFLQDNHVTVSVDPSIATKLGGGLDFWLNEKWALNIEASYFQTEIKKDARDPEKRWGILGDDVIGNEEIQIGVGLRYRF